MISILCTLNELKKLKLSKITLLSKHKLLRTEEKPIYIETLISEYADLIVCSVVIYMFGPIEQ